MVRDEPFAHAFTVFTATYNRAHTLPRVYDSLRKQTFTDFEWLIVDDTRETVERWQHEADFPIRYVLQSHAGKHVAFNRGVREAAGALFLPLDSDDSCIPVALERFKYHWDAIPRTQRPNFSAVTALTVDENGALVGSRFDRDIDDSDPLELYFVRRVSGDKWGFHRTEILAEYPFPEPEGVTFVAEAVVWFAIARRFKTRYVNECLGIISVVRRSADHLSTLTDATVRGRLMFNQAVIQDYSDYLSRSPVLFWKSLLNYSRYSWLSGKGPIAQVRAVQTTKGRLLVAPFVPVGAVFAIRDRHRM